jgi:phage shock protein C
MAELRRPLNGRVIGGVCAALAHRFGWDVTIVRILAVVSILLPGPQVIAYLIGWLIIPAEQRSEQGSTAAA